MAVSSSYLASMPTKAYGKEKGLPPMAT